MKTLSVGMILGLMSLWGTFALADGLAGARLGATKSFDNDNCTWSVINTEVGGGGACQCTDVARGCSDGCGAYSQVTYTEENSCTGEIRNVSGGEEFLCGNGC